MKLTKSHYFLSSGSTSSTVESIRFADGTVWNYATVLGKLAASDQVINGTAGADTLNGGAGNDTLSGLAGTDTLNGNAGNDTLDGGASADKLAGGLGDDTYVVDVTGDVVTEAANAGTDLVKSTITYTLGANLENLTLTGTTAINGTGNALNNVLMGNSGKNTLTGGDGDDVLNGGAGTDTLVGGNGNDTYFLDVSTDVVTEAVNAGTDTVNAAFTYTLSANLENLTLTGMTAINGTGNASANTLMGNTGVNVLTGNAGNDVLDGKAGADSLIGGTGNDTYKLGRGYGADTITENDATAGNTDLALFDAGIAVDQLWFQKVGNNLQVDIIGTSDKFTLNNWYLGNQYHVEQFKTSDGKVLLDSAVQNLVQAMAAFSPPAAGQTTLAAGYATTLNPVIAANWH